MLSFGFGKPGHEQAVSAYKKNLNSGSRKQYADQTMVQHTGLDPAWLAEAMILTIHFISQSVPVIKMKYKILKKVPYPKQELVKMALKVLNARAETAEFSWHVQHQWKATLPAHTLASSLRLLGCLQWGKGSQPWGSILPEISPSQFHQEPTSNVVWDYWSCSIA